MSVVKPPVVKKVAFAIEAFSPNRRLVNDMAEVKQKGLLRKIL